MIPETTLKYFFKIRPQITASKFGPELCLFEILKKYYKDSIECDNEQAIQYAEQYITQLSKYEFIPEIKNTTNK